MDYVKVLQEFIAIDTSAPPGLNYEKAIDYLDPFFKSAGFTTEKVQIPQEFSDGNEPRINLLAHKRSPGRPRLIFYSHIDVVPAEGWPAFEPRAESGRIYGRGAADMKGSLIALLAALERVKDKPLKYDISVMVTTDEEVGQAQQLRYLKKYLEPLAGSVFFDLDSSFGAVFIASLGAIHLDILVKGKSVHSAMAHLGENAVENAALLVNALLKLKKEVIKRKSRIDAEPPSGLKKMEARLNINVMKGGLKVNIIPDECLISIDRRLIPEENIEQAEKELMDTLKSVKGVRWEVSRIFRIDTVPPVEDTMVDNLANIIKEVTGSTGKYGEMGSGDFAPISTEWGAKHFGSGVIRPGNNIHGHDEFVNIKDIEDMATIIAKFISD